MRNLIATQLLILLVNNGFAQTEKAEHKLVSGKFENYFNHEMYDSIFDLFAPEMQRALPLEKTKGFLSGLKSQAGNITEREFIKYESTVAIYRTKFERAEFALKIALNATGEINGLRVAPYIPENLPLMERNSTKLRLPFNGTWTVFWGGDTKELNYHVESKAQKNAFDIVITNKEGKSYKTNGKTNEDYLAFGQEILAPCDGEVVLAVEGIKDNKPGSQNPIYLPGNSVIIKTKNNEYLFFAHFKQHSIKVKEGQKVTQGQVLGLCGNTGNSSEPHLHFHIQNVEDMNMATGVKCYFDEIIVNGQSKRDYSPIKGDIIENGKQ